MCVDVVLEIVDVCGLCKKYEVLDEVSVVGDLWDDVWKVKVLMVEFVGVREELAAASEFEVYVDDVCMVLEFVESGEVESEMSEML